MISGVVCGREAQRCVSDGHEPREDQLDECGYEITAGQGEIGQVPRHNGRAKRSLFWPYLPEEGNDPVPPGVVGCEQPIDLKPEHDKRMPPHVSGQSEKVVKPARPMSRKAGAGLEPVFRRILHQNVEKLSTGALSASFAHDRGGCRRSSSPDVRAETGLSVYVPDLP
jgi:hypothetical protein